MSAKRIVTCGIMQQIHRADARDLAKEAVGHPLTYRADRALSPGNVMRSSEETRCAERGATQLPAKKKAAKKAAKKVAKKSAKKK